MGNFLKKTAAVIGAVMTAAALFGFAACTPQGGEGGNPSGGTPSGGTPSGGNPSGGTTEVVTEIDPSKEYTLTLAYKEENMEETILRALGTSFHAKYPNVNVVYKAFSGVTATAIDKLIRGNQAPDVFMSNSFDMLALDDYGYLFDFTPYIEKEEKAGTFDRSEYYETYLKLGQKNFDGAQYLFSRSADRIVVHYNKKIIREAEAETGEHILDLIHNGWTWDDFNKVCELLNKYSVFRDNPTRTLVDSNLDWEAIFNPIMQHFNVRYFDDEGNLTFDSPEAKQALDMFKSWTDRGIISSPTSGQAADFDNGEGVMHFQSRSVSDTIDKLVTKGAFPDISPSASREEILGKISEYYDVVTLPVFEDDPLIGAGAAGYCAYNKTQCPEVVWQFMKHLISREGQNAIADSNVHLVPVRKDMADPSDPENHWGIGYENFNLEAYTYHPEWNCYTDYFVKAGLTRHANALNSAFGSAIMVYAAGTPYETAMNSLTRSVQGILRK